MNPVNVQNLFLSISLPPVWVSETAIGAEEMDKYDNISALQTNIKEISNF